MEKDLVSIKMRLHKERKPKLMNLLLDRRQNWQIIEMRSTLLMPILCSNNPKVSCLLASNN
jgi:hypothetical protein